MKKFLCIALLLAPACAIPGDAAWSDAHATGYGAGVSTTLSGSVSVPDIDFGDASDITDFDGTLSLAEGKSTSTFYGGRLGIAPFELIYSSFNHASDHPDQFTATLTDPNSGSVFLDETVDYTTSLDFDLEKLMLGLDLFNSPTFRIGLLFGVDLMTFNEFGMSVNEDIVVNDGLGGGDFTIIAAGEGYSIATNEQLPIPMIGIRLDALLPFSGLRAGIEASGFTLKLDQEADSIDVTYLDIDANLNYAFNDFTEAMIGYRSISLELNGSIADGTGSNTNITSDIDYSGPYFGVGFVF